MSTRVALLFEAQAVAMTARLADAERMAGQPRPSALLPERVDGLRVQAEEVLARDDPLRRAILSFATMYEEHRRDLAVVQSLGLTLEAAVAAALELAPAQSFPKAQAGDPVGRAVPPAPYAAPDPAHWPAPVGLDRADLT